MAFVYYGIGVIFGILIVSIVMHLKREDPDATIEFDIYNNSEPIKLILHKDVGYLMSKTELKTNVIVRPFDNLTTNNIYNSYNDKTDTERGVGNE